MNQNLTVTREFHVTRRHHGRKQLRDGAAQDVPSGRVPRISRLMALAIRCHQLIRNGIIADQGELAHFGHITPSRMTQIMMLLNLASQVFPGMVRTLQAASLEGDWIGRRPQGQIELQMRDGNFRWDYNVTDNHQLLSGKHEVIGNRLLLATQDGSQMVGTVDRSDENQFTFRLLGESDKEPGVVFVRRS